MALLKKLFSSGATDLIKNVGEVVDEIHTSKEEKEELKIKLKEMLLSYEEKLNKEVTERWRADLNSDNKLSKNIRPLALIFISVVFVIISFMDGNLGSFKLNPSYIPVYQTLLLSIYGAYFVGRTINKINAKKSEKV